MWLRLSLVAFAILGVLVFVVVPSHSFENCVQEKTQSYADKTAEEKPNAVFVNSVCFVRTISAEHGILTALATIILAVYTARLWWSTDRLAKITADLHDRAKEQERISRIHERAYLDAGPGGGFAPPDLRGHTRGEAKDGKVKIRLQITNHGRTPATIVRMCWHVKPREGLPQTPSYTHWEGGGMKITPNGIPFQTRYSREYEVGSSGRVAYGCVEYTDVFGDLHKSGFLLSIVKDGDDFTHPPLYEKEYEKYWEQT